MVIFELLRLKEKLDSNILKKYESKLTRAFQIRLDLEVDVEWHKISRMSKESNYIIVVGRTTLPNGNGDMVETDVSYVISAHILENKTPYQLAEHIQEVLMAKEILPPNEFAKLVSDPDFDDDFESSIKELQAIYEERQIMKNLEQSKKELRNNPPQEVPEELKGFDLSGLSQEQIEKLRITMVSKKEEEQNQ